MKAESIPSWGADLRDMVLKAIFMSVLWTIFMLLSGTGLLRASPVDRIAPDGVWAGILASLGPALWAFLLLSLERNDNGFRAKGLPGLLISGVLLGALTQLASMLLWPVVVDNLVHGNTVIAMYSSDLLTFGLAAVCVLAMFAWCSLCMLGFAGRSMAAGLAGACTLFAVAGLGAWQGIGLFDSPPTKESFLVWAVIAALGLILLPVVAALAKRGMPDPVAGYPEGPAHGWEERRN